MLRKNALHQQKAAWSALCEFVHGAAKVDFRPLRRLLHLDLRFKADHFDKPAKVLLLSYFVEKLSLQCR